jgi:hypothetical protein
MSDTLITRLWSSFRDALTRLRATLQPLHTQTRKERADLRRALAQLEDFVRRVVLLEAMTLRPGFSDREPSGSHPRWKTRGPRKPTLRLWPRQKRGAPRIRQLGPPTLVRDIWRDQHRAALIARLKTARRRPITTRLADRIDALENILAAPLRAAKRLARKLARLPLLALKLVMARLTAARGIDPALYGELQDTLFPPAFALNSS